MILENSMPDNLGYRQGEKNGKERERKKENTCQNFSACFGVGGQVVTLSKHVEGNNSIERNRKQSASIVISLLVLVSYLYYLKRNHNWFFC